MRSSGWTPSIVPNGDDQTIYLVKDYLGRLGAVWREADAEATDLVTVIRLPASLSTAPNGTASILAGGKART